MFNLGEIWAYPTDTSFGLGVRADDVHGLERLANIKGGRENKHFSLMCADEEMLLRFAELPEGFDVRTFFFEKPRTAILRPRALLPQSRFWPVDRVAFRISTITEIAREIAFPVTATSANQAGREPIFSVREAAEVFGDHIRIYDAIGELSENEPSEIWDLTQEPPERLR